MKIIFSNYDSIGNPQYNGGGAIAIHEVAKRLAKTHTVEVVSGNFPGGKNQVIDAVSYRRIGFQWLSGKVNQLLYSAFLPFVLKKSQFDIWLESFTPPFSTGLLPLFSQKPIIAVAHGLFAEELSKKYHFPFHIIEKIGLRFYKTIITPSQIHKSKIEKTVSSKTKVVVIGNAVSLPDISTVDKTASLYKNYFLFLGRIDVHQKGLDLLIEAIADIKDPTFPPVLIAGDGPSSEKEKLKTLIKQHNLQKKVRMIGRVEDKQKYNLLLNALAVVVPSRYEAECITALEAIHYNKAIVCFDIEGLRWIPGNEKMIWKIPPSRLDIFTRILQEISSMPKKSLMSIQRSIHIMDWDEVAEKYESVIQQSTLKTQNQDKNTGILGLVHSILSTLFSPFGLFCFTAVLMTFSIRGQLGNPDIFELNTDQWKDNGPLELSPERGRFALMYSWVEENSVQYSLPIAKFTTPDLGFSNDKYVSLFAPGVSFLLIPGYVIGKMLGASQVGTFAVVSFFALLNAILIKKIADYLKIHPVAGTISALFFLFGSPAFAYGVSLYQHHISTFLILAAFYLLLRWKGWISLTLIWLLCAASIPVDYPNAFLMFPIGIFALTRIISLEYFKERTEIQIRPLYVLTFIGVVIPLAFFAWFNALSYNNPLQFSGTVLQIQSFDSEDNPLRFDGTRIRDPIPLEAINENTTTDRSAVAFFQTRNIRNGFHTHFLSLDRGMWFYTPILLLGILGIPLLYKKNQVATQILLAVIGVNVLLYSMWGDPYGGWAFGSRYLIPGYALLSVLLAAFISQHRKNILVLLIIAGLGIYSIGVNTIGALTTNRLPPKVEVLALEAVTNKQEKYTYGRNYDMLVSGQTKSFLFNTYFSSKITALKYYSIIVGTISLPIILGLILLITDPKKASSNEK